MFTINFLKILHRRRGRGGPNNFWRGGGGGGGGGSIPFAPPPPNNPPTCSFNVHVKQQKLDNNSMYQFNIMYFLYYLEVHVFLSSIPNFAILSVFNVINVIIWHWLGAGAPISLMPAKTLVPLGPQIFWTLHPPRQYSNYAYVAPPPIFKLRLCCPPPNIQTTPMLHPPIFKLRLCCPPPPPIFKLRLRLWFETQKWLP